MGKPRFIAGVDIGSTKICALAAEMTPDGNLSVLEVSTVPARGIHKGTIVDLEEATSTVARALNEVASATRSRIDRVLLGTSAAVASLNNRGTSTLLQRNRGITLEDVRKAVAAAADVGLPSSRQVIHVIPHQFFVDGQASVNNPLGLFGQRLDADAHIVTMAAPAIRALIACVEQCGAEVEEVAAQPLAAAQAVLALEERDMGVAVADLGGAGCSVSVFVDDSPWHTATVPVGGRHITQDVATVLGIAYDVAEELKLASGHAKAEVIDASEELEVPLVEGDAEIRVSRRDLCEIIEARVQELIGLIGEEIQRSGYSGLLPAGLVITGGTAQLPGIAEVASETLQMRVRIGQPEAAGATGLNGPAYASAAGLLLWGSQATSRHWWTYPSTAAEAPVESSKSSPVARWLRAFWPSALGGERPGQR